MSGILYVVTSPSGKRYVGITSRGLSTRWRQHCAAAARGKNSPLCAAIRKYGKTEFSVEAVVAADWQLLNELEVKVISLLGSLRPAGYNLASGGNQALHHEETKERFRKNAMKPDVNARLRRIARELRMQQLKDPVREAAVAAKISATKKGVPWTASRRQAQERRKH